LQNTCGALWGRCYPDSATGFTPLSVSIIFLKGDSYEHTPMLVRCQIANTMNKLVFKNE